MEQYKSPLLLAQDRKGVLQQQLFLLRQPGLPVGNGVPFLIVEILSSVRIPQLHQAEIPADRQDPSHW